MPYGENDPRSPTFGLLPQNQPVHPLLDFLVRAASIPTNTWGGATRAAAQTLDEIDLNKVRNVQGAVAQGYNTGQIPETAVHKRGWGGQLLQSLGVLGEPKPEPLDPSEQAGAAWGAHLNKLEAQKDYLARLKAETEYRSKAVDAANKIGLQDAIKMYPGAGLEELPVGSFLSQGEERSRKNQRELVGQSMRAAEMGGPEFGDRMLRMLGVPEGPQGEQPTLGLPREFIGTGQARSRAASTAEDRAMSQKRRQAFQEKSTRVTQQRMIKKDREQQAKARLTAISAQLTATQRAAEQKDPKALALLPALREQWVNAYKILAPDLTPEQEAALRLMTTGDMIAHTAQIGGTNIDLGEAAGVYMGK